MSDDDRKPALAVVPAGATQVEQPPPPKNKGRAGAGRPPLADEGVLNVFFTAVKAGNRLQVAARYAGLNPTMVEGWRRRGEGRADRPATPRYIEFVERLEQAKAEAEVFAMAQVRRGMLDTPTAAIWWLRNQSPEWRQDGVAPPIVSQAPVNVSATLSVTPNIVVVPREAIEEVVRQRLEAAREGEDPDAQRAARARLVSDNAED